MAQSDQWHYTDQAGQQAGPIPTDELLERLAAKQIQKSAMAWKEGMPSWLPISQIEELKITPQTAPVPPSSPTDKKKTAQKNRSDNPYQPPAQQETSTEAIPGPPETALSYQELHGGGEHDGIGRFSYWITRPLLYLILLGLPTLAANFLLEPGSALIVCTVAVLIMCVLAIRLHCLRFQNIGISAWWTLGLIVPLLNLPLYLMLSICPAGYAQTRKLDLVGKILAFFIIIVPVAIIALSILTNLGTHFIQAAEKAKENFDPKKPKQESVAPQSR